MDNGMALAGPSSDVSSGSFSHVEEERPGACLLCLDYPMNRAGARFRMRESPPKIPPNLTSESGECKGKTTTGLSSFFYTHGSTSKHLWAHSSAALAFSVRP